MKKFYLSTAIPYVNYVPHCGFALEIIQADVIARYRRFLGEDVFFLTGTDENSLKNVQAARREGISVKELVDRNANKFYELKKVLNLSFNDFIRTTETRHVKGAQKFWRACQKDIYKKTYKGLYCVGCEEFYKESELINGLCPEHKTRPELVKEENYFFRLSKYQDKFKKIIAGKKVKIIPETRQNEVMSFINSGLEDICVSRAAGRGQGWGIPVPGDPSQILWTWYDALSNYVNAVGYYDNPERFKKWWPADLHIVGKGVIRFHAIYWIAMLLSAGLALPKSIFVHGYLTVGGQKMSKSLGNVVDPFKLVEKYGTDPVRYFLLREILPTEDGDFTYQKFEGRYNADLARGLGNFVARVITLATKCKMQNAKCKITIQNLKLKKEIDRTRKKYQKALEEFKFNEALIAIWGLIGFCDKYIERQKPWELLSQAQSSNLKAQKFEEILSNLLFTLANIGSMLRPFLPETADKIFEQLGIKPVDKKWKFVIHPPKFYEIKLWRIKKGKSLFPRI